MPTALIVRTAGTNCDAELARAFELAGASTTLVHLDRLIADPTPIAGASLIGLPGGFSYGDDIASGRIFAMKASERLFEPMAEAVDRGVPIIGVCNGFQVLVQMGLLPGPDDGGSMAGTKPKQRLALTDNSDARFHDRWVQVEPAASPPCVWLRSMRQRMALPSMAATLTLPVAHGEGRLLAADSDVLAAIEADGRACLRYVDNFNGSVGSIAGVCDRSGLVFGLMPHPERYLDWTRHPHWTRLPEEVRSGDTPGLAMFKDAVAFAARTGTAAGAASAG
ncbi:MAG: phosphoribosylformylglycinamidine synthase subunit PurQ [Planctomycetota bacterium]